MANDAFVLEQTIDIALGEAGDPVKVEIMERGAEILPLDEDGAPAQSGLKALQAQFLEQAVIIADREAPFAVVIVQELRCGAAPAATWLAVRARYCHVHVPAVLCNGRHFKRQLLFMQSHECGHRVWRGIVRIHVQMHMLSLLGGVFGHPVSCNLFPPADPYRIVALNVIEKARQRHRACGIPADPAMQADAHHGQSSRTHTD